MRKFNGALKLSSLPLERFKAETEKQAKEIFLKRHETGEPGDALSDWLKAEKGIKAKYHIP